MIRKILKIFAGVILVLIAFVFSLLLWIALDPQGVWENIGRRFVPEDLSVNWSRLEFQPKRQNWLQWVSKLKIADLHIKKTKPEIDLKIDQATFEYTISLFRPRTYLRVHNFELNRISGRFAPVPAKEPTPELSPYQLTEKILSRLDLMREFLTIEKLMVTIQDFQIVQDLSSGQLSAELKSSGSAAFDHRLEWTQGPMQIRASGRVDLENETVLDSLVTAAHRDQRLSSQGRMEVRRKMGKIVVSYDGNLKVQGREAVFKLESDLQRDHWTVTAHGNVSGFPDPLGRIENLNVKIVSPMRDGHYLSAEPSTFEISAPLRLFSVKPAVQRTLNRWCRCEWPESHVVRSNGKVWLKPLRDRPQRKEIVAEGTVTAETTSNALVDLNLFARYKLFTEAQRWIFLPALESNLRIKSFQSMRQVFRAHGILIPAPLDTLEGTFSVHAESPLNLQPDFSETLIHFAADLKSPKQIVDLKGQASLRLNTGKKVLDVSVRTEANQIVLELPPLDPFLGIPKLARDSRVQVRPSTKMRGSAFRVNLTFAASTLSPGALKFLSPLAEPHVPITLDVKRTQQGDLIGSIKSEPFKIRYLKRVAHIEQMQVVFDQREDADFSLRGRVRFDATQYKIWAEIDGTLLSPLIRLRSEPELSRSDIISVLLYDRVSEQLVSADRETANSFEAALVDRAIGLFGLWAFASTPIRSFQYNPVTKVYTATVQIANDVTAGIGTDWESSAQFELRKRVSRQWVLSASWAPGEMESQVGKIVLQWERRF